MRFEVVRRIEFDAAHRVMRHESKCRYLHGHRYVLHLYAVSEELDEIGRVVDFGVLKEKIGAWIDLWWDHTTILHRDDTKLIDSLTGFCKHGWPYVLPYNPTAENLGKYLLDIVIPKMHLPVRVERIRVDETPNCAAIVEY